MRRIESLAPTIALVAACGAVLIEVARGRLDSASALAAIATALAVLSRREGHREHHDEDRPRGPPG